MKSFLVSGDRSGAGKTTITLALCSILAKEGTVQAYKTAMDYIDTSYLSGVTKRPAYNLDSFVQSDEEMEGLFAYGASDADFGVVEGVRGLYEGRDAFSDAGSTASIAKRFNLPVILVLNARSITRSAAAVVLGFQKFDPEVSIAGVILNNVGSKRHVEKASSAIEHYCGIPVFGAVPRDSAMELCGRHLGLVPFYEKSAGDSGFSVKIDEIAGIVSECIDIDAVKAAAREVAPKQNSVSERLSSRPKPSGKVAVAYDEAFNFYYGETDAVISSLGYAVEYFSPIHDSLPDADGYLFGGGYPEIFASKLSENASIMEDIACAAKYGSAIYAECGGLMYLTRSLSVSGNRYPMCGVIPGECIMPAVKRLGYVTGEAYLNGKTLPFAGHEFHYSGVCMDDNADYAFRLSRGEGICGGKDGAVFKNTIAGYTHLMPVSSQDIYREIFAGDGL